MSTLPSITEQPIPQLRHCSVLVVRLCAGVCCQAGGLSPGTVIPSRELSSPCQLPPLSVRDATQYSAHGQLEGGALRVLRSIASRKLEPAGAGFWSRRDLFQQGFGAGVGVFWSRVWERSGVLWNGVAGFGAERGIGARPGDRFTEGLTAVEQVQHGIGRCRPPAPAGAGAASGTVAKSSAAPSR